MEGHEAYDIFTKLTPYLSKLARKRITSIQKQGGFVDKLPIRQMCCPECGHTNNPNHIPCCNMDKRRDGSECLHWTIKTGAVHSIIPNLMVILKLLITDMPHIICGISYM